MELGLRFIGGTNGPVNFCCVMKGCSFACWGDHRSSGLRQSKPRTKSMNEFLLAISGPCQQLSYDIKILRIPRSISTCFMFFLGKG